MSHVVRFVCALLPLVISLPEAAASPPGDGRIDPRLDLALRRGFAPRVVETPRGLEARIERWDVARIGGEVSAAAAAEPRITVFVVGSVDAPDLAALGGVVRRRAGTVATVELPVSAAAAASGLPGVERLALPGTVRALLDRSLPAVGIPARTRVGDAWSGATGEGVLVGIVDSGVDVNHENFLDEPGSTRILYYWSQVDTTGTPPAESPDLPGSEWTKAHIDAGTAGGPDSLGHGTHVASIAAGGGRAANADSLRYRYAGVAPEADIVAVQAILTEDRILDGVAYVFAKADQLGKRAVVNLSVGSQFGPHDGTTPLEIALDALAGPDRLLVASAGNDGESWIHAEIVVAPGASDSAGFTVSYPSGPSDVFNVLDIDAYYEGPGALEATVVSPSGHRYGPYPAGAFEPDTLTAEGTLYVAHQPWAQGSDTKQLFVEVSDLDIPQDPGTASVPPAEGTWRIVVRNVGAAPVELDLWIPLAFPMWAAWEEAVVDEEEILTSPASGASVIAVGSFNTRRCWTTGGGERCSGLAESLTTPGDVTYFSSWGPTRDGREKPEMVAPGFVIVAAKSDQLAADWETYFGIPLADVTGHDARHMVQAGTSMAAPHVTGALALALAERSLTPAEAVDLLRETAATDAATGPAWNPRAGHGKLDIGALVGNVPAAPRGLGLSYLTDGAVELYWQAGDDPVLGFALERRREGAWESLGAFPGSGPHRWRDPSAAPGDRYRVWAEHRDGGRELWGEAEVAPMPRPGLAIPNPFRGATRIALPASRIARGVESADVLDAAGRRVATVSVPAGASHAVWDGLRDDGESAAPGVYWVRFRSRGGSGVRVVRIP